MCAVLRVSSQSSFYGHDASGVASSFQDIGEEDLFRESSKADLYLYLWDGESPSDVVKMFNGT